MTECTCSFDKEKEEWVVCGDCYESRTRTMKVRKCEICGFSIKFRTHEDFEFWALQHAQTKHTRLIATCATEMFTESECTCNCSDHYCTYCNSECWLDDDCRCDCSQSAREKVIQIARKHSKLFAELDKEAEQ